MSPGKGWLAPSRFPRHIEWYLHKCNYWTGGLNGSVGSQAQKKGTWSLICMAAWGSGRAKTATDCSPCEHEVGGVRHSLRPVIAWAPSATRPSWLASLNLKGSPLSLSLVVGFGGGQTWVASWLHCPVAGCSLYCGKCLDFPKPWFHHQ